MYTESKIRKCVKICEFSSISAQIPGCPLTPERTLPTQTTVYTGPANGIFPLKLRGTARDKNAEYCTHFPKRGGTKLHGSAVSRLPLENRGQRKSALSAVLALSWRGRKRRSAKSVSLQEVSVQSPSGDRLASSIPGCRACIINGRPPFFLL